MLPSVNALAAEFRVGNRVVMKAVKALSEQGLVESRDRVGTFVSNSGHRTQTRGLILPTPNSPLGEKLKMGVMEACRTPGYAVAVEHYAADPESIPRLIHRLVDDMDVGGLVLWLPVEPPTDLSLLQERGVPFVVCTEFDAMRHADSHSVSNAGSVAMAEVMTHLLGLGHRSIGFVCEMLPEEAPEHSHIRQRYGHYRRALEICGLPLHEPLVIGSLFADHAITHEPLTPAQLESLRSFTAVCCDTDRSASFIMRECLRNGIAVPGELAVTGYDNTIIGAWFGLTSVEQHYEKIGRRAVEILYEDIDGKLDGPRHDQIDSELVIRGSTTAVPPGWTPGKGRSP
jgi:LacI family transcriptional regulator